MDKSEKRFERDIESFLISPEGGYTQFCGQDAEGNWVHTRQHDVSKCIYMDVLCEFIAKTQPKEWAKYTKYYGASAADKLYHRLETTISNQGLLYVLRNGIEDMGCKLKVCFFKPESNLNPLAIELYEANILGCARQFRYTTANTNTIDMVLSVNGIPVVALELKNQLTGQDYVCAINQFKHDRSSKEFAFRLNHRFLVYFAVDLYEAWMTTRLADGGTRFLPFNQGSNGAGVTGGAGNPQNPNGYATSYLWEEVLQRDSLLDLIHRFISFVKEKEEVVKNGVTKTVTKEKMIFPRYHQYDVVRKIMADVRENGVGTNYLIQHSAGSGKSNSIAWIAYRLASVHDVENNGLFDSVIVVTNRVVLDSQLQDTINSFEHQVGLVEAIDDTQLVRLHDRDLFNEYQYTLHLVRLLPRSGGDEFVDIEDKIKLEYASLTETFRGAIVLDEKPPVFVPGGSTAPKVPNKKKDTLQSIIDKVNERFSGNFTDADRVIIEGIYQMFMKDSEVKKFRKYAKDNSTEMFVRSLFPDKFRDIVTQCFLDNNDSFAKLFNDPDFYQKVQEAMAQELYKALRKE